MRDGLLDTVSGILHAIMMKLYSCKIILYVTNPRKQQYSGLINDIKDILCLLEWPAADSSPDIIINPIEHVCMGFFLSWKSKLESVMRWCSPIPIIYGRRMYVMNGKKNSENVKKAL